MGGASDISKLKKVWLPIVLQVDGVYFCVYLQICVFCFRICSYSQIPSQLMLYCFQLMLRRIFGSDSKSLMQTKLLSISFSDAAPESFYIIFIMAMQSQSKDMCQKVIGRYINDAHTHRHTHAHTPTRHISEGLSSCLYSDRQTAKCCWDVTDILFILNESKCWDYCNSSVCRLHTTAHPAAAVPGK